MRPELTGSADLFIDLRLGRALLHVYAEAATTRRAGGVSRLVPEANTDAGTALDGAGGGRIQLSEVRVV